jgi:hypothetical protein
MNNKCGDLWVPLKDSVTSLELAKSGAGAAG